MSTTSISEQLQHDYPECKIYLDVNNRMIVADDYKMSLLNSTSALESMNIFSQSGKNFYQAITQLLYSHYELLPRKGSYASTLIILKEDLKKYKVQKLAKEWGIGFLEDNKEVLALEVDDGVERELLLGSPEIEGELESEELEEWAKLEEIDFNTEIAYMEKGLEFASAMEELESRGKDVELGVSEVIESGNEIDIEKFKFKNLIKKIFGKGL